MPVELDIAGNFAAGQKATLDRRRARQYERMNDIELANDNDALLGRRSGINRERAANKLDPLAFDPVATNGDPMYLKLVNWWKQKRANRVMPSNMQPAQVQSVNDEMGELGMEDYGDPAQTFPMEGGGGAITSTPMYRDGGKVRAIPRYAEGGEVANEADMVKRRNAAQQSMSREARAARAAEFKRNGMSTTTAQTGRGGAIPREGMVRRATNSMRGRGVSAAGRARAVRGGAIAAGAALVPQFDENYDQTLERRFGFAEPNVPAGGQADGKTGTFVSEDEGDASLAGYGKYLGRRALGYASDLANTMTFGAAGNLYRDKQQDPQAQPAQPEAPAAIPRTPDEAIAQQAISEGKQMAEEATAQSAPPGAIDFSKVDFDAGDIPNMPVRDWVEYRAGMVSDLMMQGMSAPDAHAKVTQMQQQGFIDYAQQSLMHLQAGNPDAAATALRAAYQYFPNGTDVQLGAQQGKDGQPVLVGQGRDEETGEPKGKPMILNSERLSVMIENFSNPDAFRTWTKDWRDEQFNRQKYEEVEKPEAESNAQYRDRAGRAAERNAEANMVDAERQAAGTGRRQSDLDRANEVFREASFELASDQDPGQADRIASLMSMLYARKPDWQDNQVVDFVKEAIRRGDIDKVMAAVGVGE